jgi:hypothetical protein
MSGANEISTSGRRERPLEEEPEGDEEDEGRAEEAAG